MAERKRESGPMWKRKVGALDRDLSRLEDLPGQLVSRRGALTTTQKRDIYEKGIPAKATILAPPKYAVPGPTGGAGTWTVRIEIEGREPYEVKTMQDMSRTAWEYLAQPGVAIDARVDPDDPKRLVLIPPAHPERSTQYTDSARLLEGARRATATVTRAEKTNVTAPGGDDPVYVLELELRAEGEPRPWRVKIAQRVPPGAEDMVGPGTELRAGYREVDEGDSVVIDWDASA